MAGVGVRTRHASQSKLADYLGPGKALLYNELPTLRAILRQGLLFQEEKLLLQDTEKKHYPISEHSKEMVGVLINQWLKANISFFSSCSDNKIRSPEEITNSLGDFAENGWKTILKGSTSQRL